MMYCVNIVDIDATLLCMIFHPSCLYECFFVGLYVLGGFSQAYTMELEAEVAKLKEENKELQRKQVTLFDASIVKKENK